MFYTDLIDEKKILQRKGWTKSKVDLFLGKPDKVMKKVNKAGDAKDVKYWSAQRIDFIQGCSEFNEMQ
jgi:hypothetical protein